MSPARVAALACVVLAAACTTDPCKEGTLFLTYSLSGGAEVADTIDVTIAVGGGAPRTMSVHRAGGATGSIEVDFDAYPSGQSLAVTLAARGAGGALAASSQTTTAAPGCTALMFALDGGARDLAGAEAAAPDLSGSDGAVADLARADAPVPDLADAAVPDLAGTDAAVPDLASADQARPPDLASTDLAFVPGNLPSCVNLAASCGVNGTDTCCASPLVAGGMFFRSYDPVNDGFSGDMKNPATVSDFRLDTYEVTVGRFRKFVEAGLGNQGKPPQAGAGANPYIANSGWDPAWNASLAVDTNGLKAALKCSVTYQTWTDNPAGAEARPINCVDWFEAFAFCAWDGGFLPTEAEWNYAAAGGAEQRPYPWSQNPQVLDINCSDDNYFINNPMGNYCVNGVTGATNVVGSESTKGDGKWGQSDLGGNVAEWTLDWLGAYPNACTDCANLVPQVNRAVRGGSFHEVDYFSRAANRSAFAPTTHTYNVGLRCARPK